MFREPIAAVSHAYRFGIGGRHAAGDCGVIYIDYARQVGKRGVANVHGPE